MKKITFIIQARMGSSRLPDKIFLPFYEERCILDLLIEKLQHVDDTDIIVATSVDPKNDVIESFCKEHGIKCFRGSEDDVLQRFIDAAEAFGAENIVRVCSDNPFIELNSIKLLVDQAKISEAEYISFRVNGKPSITTHYGFWTEYTTVSALKQIKSLTEDRLYHEHVTNYIYSHPEDFRIEWLPGPECLQGRSDIRLTCDTKEDFNSAKAIYQVLCADNKYPTIQRIVDYLNMHKEFVCSMVEQIKVNSK